MSWLVSMSTTMVNWPLPRRPAYWPVASTVRKCPFAHWCGVEMSCARRRCWPYLTTRGPPPLGSSRRGRLTKARAGGARRARASTSWCEPEQDRTRDRVLAAVGEGDGSEREPGDQPGVERDRDDH